MFYSILMKPFQMTPGFMTLTMMNFTLKIVILDFVATGGTSVSQIHIINFADLQTWLADIHCSNKNCYKFYQLIAAVIVCICSYICFCYTIFTLHRNIKVWLYVNVI